MKPKDRERLEKSYKVYKIRRIDRIVIKLIVFLVVNYVSFTILSNITDPLVLPIYKVIVVSVIFAFSVVAIFRYWWMDSIETRISLGFNKAYERLGYFLVDRGKYHLYKAESYISEAMIEINELSKETSSQYYRPLTKPLKELRANISEKIIPLNSKRKDLAQIYEITGGLALLFLDLEPRRIINLNKKLKAMQVYKQENFFRRHSRIIRAIEFYLGCFGFLVAVFVFASYFLGADWVKSLREQLAVLMGVSVPLAAFLWTKTRVGRKK